VGWTPIQPAFGSTVLGPVSPRPAFTCMDEFWSCKGNGPPPVRQVIEGLASRDTEMTRNACASTKRPSVRDVLTLSPGRVETGAPG
jgi:hypothetical protein